jgi:hypothetical protein
MADEGPCPDGVPWCTDHYSYPADTFDLHRSARKDLPLRRAGASHGNARAHAVQVAERGYRAGVSLEIGVMPGEVLAEHFYMDGPAHAELIAKVIERLAPATFAQHLALAAQLRTASAVAFGNPETKEGSQ